MPRKKQIKIDSAKQKRIKKEIDKLNKLFKNLDKDKMDTGTSLIKNASFMMITLEDLQNHINEHGAVSEYQNGENQWGSKKSPEVDIYNTMIKNHMAIIKQLTDLLPKGEKTEGDGFDEFINKK